MKPSRRSQITRALAVSAYTRELWAAHRQSRRLGFAVPPASRFLLPRPAVLTPDAQPRLAAAIQGVLGRFTADEVAFRCVESALAVRPTVEDAFGRATLLTVGFVAIRGRRGWYHTEEDLERWARPVIHVALPAPRCFHAWLTLATGEIVDAALGTHYARDTGDERTLGVVMSGRPGALSGLREVTYHPTVVGDAALAVGHGLALGYALG